MHWGTLLYGVFPSALLKATVQILDPGVPGRVGGV